MENLYSLLCLLSLPFAGWQLVRLRAMTHATTADTARRWAVAATCSLLLAGLLRVPALGIPAAVSSGIHYFATVMLLTPLIAVLGARRPGSGAWPWFVVLPLIIVLQWPSISQLASGRVDTPIEIPAPTLLGFLFVLIMGAGNYFGTTLSSEAFAGAFAVFLFLLPVSPWCAWNNLLWPTLGAVLLCFCAIRVHRRFGEPPERIGELQQGVARLWVTFRDLYGIVWTKRVMDRVNQFAVRERWAWQLSLDGFVPTAKAESAQVAQEAFDKTAKRPVEILCWVLRRFVDRPFLLRFLPADVLVEAKDGQQASGTNQHGM